MPGFVHVDVKHALELAAQAPRRYLLLAIDWPAAGSTLRAVRPSPGRPPGAFRSGNGAGDVLYLTHVVTDNGKELADLFVVSGERHPTGRHPFDRQCGEHRGIDHRLTKPRRPQPNGMVERFNAPIVDILRTRHFDSGEQLQDTVRDSLQLYNHLLL